MEGSQRLSTLASLVHGSGVSVITGPRGYAFWALVSPECTVRVVPDDYESSFRTTSIDEWALLASGLSPAEVKALYARTTPLTPKHRLYQSQQAAFSLSSRLRALLGTTPSIVVQGSTADVVRDIPSQLGLLDRLSKTNELVALDLEWTYGSQTASDNDRLIGINVSTRDRNWYLPVRASDVDNSPYESVLKRTLRQYDSSQALGQGVWHNFKADIKQLYPDPLDAWGSPAHDTILMAYIAGEDSLGLKELTKKLLGRNPLKLQQGLETLPAETAARYGAAGDSRNTWDLYQVLKKRLEDTNQWDLYNDIERPLVPLVASMEKLGSPLDITEVKRLRDELTQKEREIEHDIQARYGLDFKLDSDQREYVKRNFGTDLGTLDKRVLSRITAPWVEGLLSYRSTHTLRNNFLDKHIQTWERLGRPDDYRLYPTFNQAGRDSNGSDSWLRAPATGRFSSANPNLQNQPRAIRSIFTAPDGYVLVSLDYSKLEMVVGASVSQDTVMLKALQSGDIHDFMRQKIKQETGVDVGRTAAKNAGFNLRYGGQADMLMTVAAKERAHLSYEIAKKIVDTDHSTYLRYWEWFKETVDSALRLGYSETLWGRRRYDPNLLSSDSLVRGHAERAAANMAVQGTAADIIKLAMARVVPYLKAFDAHMMLTVHDELVFWVLRRNAEAFKIAATYAMQSIQLPGIGLTVDGGIGRRWSDAH